jgi:hypothetical protein
VDDVQRLGKNRPAPDVFRRNPGADHLSVNLLAVEPIADIVLYYRERFQNGSGQVAVCQHKLPEYNQACRRTGVTLVFDATENEWQFTEGSKTSRAYLLRPFTPKGSRHSPSHSGVEYVRVFDEADELKFARRMCNKRFHLF